jgi:hypothetical protein
MIRDPQVNGGREESVEDEGKIGIAAEQGTNGVL